MYDVYCMTELHLYRLVLQLQCTTAAQHTYQTDKCRQLNMETLQQNRKEIGVLRIAIFKYLLAIILCFQLEMVAPLRILETGSTQCTTQYSAKYTYIRSASSRTLYRIDVVEFLLFSHLLSLSISRYFFVLENICLVT